MSSISATSQQQSPQLKAQLAEVYAEAQSDHWSQAEENRAIDKVIEQYGPSSASETSATSADSSLIDVSA